jgi:nucleotide-binding universal stress UspA family protein
MFKKIVVPLDGSTLAERVLPVAARLAGHDGAQIVLLRAPVPDRAYLPAAAGFGLLYPEDYLGAVNTQAVEYLKVVQSRQTGHGFPITGEVVEGDAAGAIVDAARQSHAGLIAMSSHGYSGLTRWILGSVAERVLRDADCPVLVVRSSEPIRRMLVTLDGSQISARVLEPALDVAQALGASITLLRVVPELSAAELQELDEYETGLGQRLAQEHQEDAETYLGPVAETFSRAGLAVHTLVRAGLAANVILKVVEQQAIDVVAMATHGRTGLRRWIYGSVTEKVLHNAACSMLVVRPAAHELRLSFSDHRL